MANIIDSYSESNQDSSQDITSVSLSNAVGQRFTGNGAILGSATLYIKKSDNLTVGTGSINIYDIGIQNRPTNGSSPIATATTTLDYSTLTTSYVLYNFAFSGANQITLTNGHFYGLTLEGAASTSHKVNLGSDASTPTASGNAYFEQTTTWFQTSSALCFYVYDNTDSSINVSDSTVTSEYIVSDLFTPPQPQVVEQDYTTTHDVLRGYSDTIASREQVTILAIENINVSDSIAISENVVVSIVVAGTDSVNVSDTALTSENVQLLVTGFINKSDTATTSENIQLLVTDFVSVSDTATTSESVQLLVTGFVKVSDSTATSENISVIIPSSNVFTVNVTDSVITSENIPTLQLSYGVAVTPSQSYTIQGVKVV